MGSRQPLTIINKLKVYISIDKNFRQIRLNIVLCQFCFAGYAPLIPPLRGAGGCCLAWHNIFDVLLNLSHFRGEGREDAFSDRRFRRTAVVRISLAEGFKALQALWYGIEFLPVEGFADSAVQSRGWSRETF